MSLTDVIRFGLEIGALTPSVVEACREVVAATTPAEVRRSHVRVRCRSYPRMGALAALRAPRKTVSTSCALP